MPLIIEDGSIVANADSYVSRADYIAYALARGVVIADTSVADVELVKAAQFIGAHESNLKGARVSRDQSLSFPRTEVEIDGWYWSYDEIPRNVILCQIMVAMDIHAGLDPYNPPQNKIRTKEKIDGAVEVNFQVGGNSKLSKTSSADAVLNSLLNRSGLTIAVTRA